MLEWNDKYATGVEKIDEQHRRLFKMINDFEVLVRNNTAKDRFVGALKFLGNYTTAHFAYEEGCMQRMECSVACANKKAHAKFLEAFQGFVARFNSEGYSDALANELLETAQAWLVQHICGIDTRMKHCASVS